MKAFYNSVKFITDCILKENMMRSLFRMNINFSNVKKIKKLLLFKSRQYNIFILLNIKLLAPKYKTETVMIISEQEKLVKDLADKYGRKREFLLPILQELVYEKNYLTEESMMLVAKELNISSADVYGTASFYTFLDTELMGKYVIRVCKTISCAMKGKDEILHVIHDTLKIDVGETTSDKKFSLLTTNCIGWCHKSPAMLINNIPYIELTPSKVTKILQDYIKR